MLSPAVIGLLAASGMMMWPDGLPVPPKRPGRRYRSGTAVCNCGRTISANKQQCKACADARPYDLHSAVIAVAEQIETDCFVSALKDDR